MTHCDAFSYFYENTRARIRVIRKTRHNASHASQGMCIPAAHEARLVAPAYRSKRRPSGNDLAVWSKGRGLIPAKEGKSKKAPSKPMMLPASGDIVACRAMPFAGQGPHSDQPRPSRPRISAKRHRSKHPLCTLDREPVFPRTRSSTRTTGRDKPSNRANSRTFL